VNRTVATLLRERAATHTDVAFVRFADTSLTYGEADARVDRVAAAFHTMGVGAGDLVALLLPNGAEFVVAWFALARIGAVEAPVNTAFRGRALAHLLVLSEAAVVVVDEGLADPLEPIAADLVHVRTLVVRGRAELVAARFPEWRVVSFDEFEASAADVAPPVVEVSERDPGMVLFTSGTTGRSKGCVLSHRYAVRQAELMIEHLQLVPTDVLYCPFPLFHLDASVLTVVPALVLGTTAAIAERFSASHFWDEIRAFGATVFDFMGATLAILHKQPRRDDDGDNPARLGWGVPTPDFAPDFEVRFGLRLVELYGSTDVGVPIYTPLDEPARLGSCGRPIDAYDVRLIDEDGRVVAPGDVGEIVVRPNEPSLIMDGYYHMPSETLRAWRDLWFHTGDLARADADGFLYFVGRRKDAIRRRGENISAFEVEEVVADHPDVLEVAAFGVPSELSEEDVMVAVVPRPGHVVEPVALIAHCEARMARHMVPRYVEVVDGLPKTPTEKVEKYRLVERGVTASTWDRER
jgi:crotonobetaine/carnitine-CoA ligase